MAARELTPRGLASSCLPPRGIRYSAGNQVICATRSVSTKHSSSCRRIRGGGRLLQGGFLPNGSISATPWRSTGWSVQRWPHKHGRRFRVQAFFDVPEAGPFRDALFACSGASVAFVVSAALAFIMQRNDRKVKAAAEERGPASIPEPGVIAQALEMGVGLGGQKESVEWVNMVLHKIWKVYRRSLEAWLVGLLQPAIDTLPLPSIVRRVEIAEFSLDYEPLSVRNVQRRASRRANDLQYHVGLRYTGDARCLLLLHLTVAGIDFAVPVGVHNLDVDAELWVKLRLTPRQPYVGTLSIAFVRLPTIKLVLAPFRIINLFAIPFLSSFLSKLLTVDLPKLLVLPRHITFDFLPAGEDPSQHMAHPASLVLDLLKSETFTGLAGQEPHSPTRTEPGDAFVGELSVTLCEARNLPTVGLAVFSNPYCRLRVGEAVMESKKNSETSHPAGARDPVWNQDFVFWVEDPAQQKLTVVIRDSMAPLSRNIGFVEVPIWQLQDCAPLSMWLPLLQDGPFGVKPTQGEIRLLLTYKSYVDHREGDVGNGTSKSTSPALDVVAYIKVFGSDEGEAEGEESSTEEVDSDGERERELQREREVKGLDKLGEEPGVEVLATNEGQITGSSDTVGAMQSTESPAIGSGRSSWGAAWNVAKGVAVGAVSVAGGAAAAAGGLFWAAGGLVAGGAGFIASGVSDRVKDFMAKDSGMHPDPPLYYYEDDDYFTQDSSLIRVTSHLSDEGRDGEETSSPPLPDEGCEEIFETEQDSLDQDISEPESLEELYEVKLGRIIRDQAVWNDLVAEGVHRDATFGPNSRATVEQQFARLVEWNLDSSVSRTEELMGSFATASRGLTFDDGDMWADASDNLLEENVYEELGNDPSKETEGEDMRGESADEGSEFATRDLQKGTVSHDRWRSVQGAISELMDFFNR